MSKNSNAKLVNTASKQEDLFQRLQENRGQRSCTYRREWATRDNRARWFIVLKNDTSKYYVVHIMRNKEKAASKILEYCAYVKTQFKKTVKIVKSDNGREYVNKKLKNVLAKNGTLLELTAPYNPKQNGKAECEIRTLTERARSMLHGRGLPRTLWGEAMITATYLRNMTCTFKNGNQTPFEFWHNKNPDLSKMEVFGSDCYTNIPKIKRRKWDKRVEKCIFVGYQRSNNYRVYDPVKRKVGVAAMVKFSQGRQFSVFKGNNDYKS